MTKLIIYDNKADSFICIDDMQRPLPFAPFCAPPLHSFLRLCHAKTVWTDRRAIEALDAASRTWGAPLDARLAFKCFSPAAVPSPQMLGLTLKLNLSGLTPSERCELKRLMISMGDFEKVCESYESAGVLTATKRISCSCGTPLCFPEASVGSRGVYALLLQSALAALGEPCCITGTLSCSDVAASLRAAKKLGVEGCSRIDCRVLKSIFGR